jgi:hypothetical protein
MEMPHPSSPQGWRHGGGRAPAWVTIALFVARGTPCEQVRALAAEVAAAKQASSDAARRFTGSLASLKEKQASDSEGRAKAAAASEARHAAARAAAAKAAEAKLATMAGEHMAAQVRTYTQGP